MLNYRLTTTFSCIIVNTTTIFDNEKEGYSYEAAILRASTVSTAFHHLCLFDYRLARSMGNRRHLLPRTGVPAPIFRWMRAFLRKKRRPPKAYRHISPAQIQPRQQACRTPSHTPPGPCSLSYSSGSEWSKPLQSERRRKFRECGSAFLHIPVEPKLPRTLQNTIILIGADAPVNFWIPRAVIRRCILSHQAD